MGPASVRGGQTEARETRLTCRRNDCSGLAQRAPRIVQQGSEILAIPLSPT